MGQLLSRLLLAAFITRAHANNRQPPNASKLKTDLRKMRSAGLRQERFQQALPATQRFAPRFGEAKVTERHGTQASSLTLGGDRFEYLAQGDVPVFALFVRRLNTGMPWSRFDVCRGDESIRPLCEQVVQEGGIGAESLRGKIDRFMIDRLFSSGIAGATVDVAAAHTEATSVSPPNLLVSRIKSALPQMKKLRPRDLEIGYMLAAEGEEICSLTALLLLDKEKERQQALLLFRQSEERQLTVLGEMHASNEAKLADDTRSRFSSSPAAATPAAKIDMDASLAQARSSATLSVPAALAVALDQMDEFVAQCPDYGTFDLYLCSDGSAIMCEGGCVAASAGVFATTHSLDGVGEVNGEADDEYRVIPGALRLQVSGVEGVVESPFDAELVAGLAAATLATKLALAFRQHASPAKPLGKVVILTDSKTLLRATRTGPQGNEELAKRGGEQRQAVWGLLMQKLAQLDALGVPCSFQWTAGHPERKAVSREAWTFEDWAIWEADNLASASASAPAPVSAASRNNQGYQEQEQGQEQERAYIGLTELLVLMMMQ